jgi:hypothetical protein
VTQSLPSTLIAFPFAAGLLTRGDKRAKNPPALDICLNVEFDEIGGLRTRYPYAAIGSNIFGGGTISNARRMIANGDELLLFTNDTLYSWNPQISAWVRKGTHLAVKTSEQSTFVTTADQIDCDRAELAGTVVITWVQLVGATSVGVVAAFDKATGNVLMQPTQLAGSAARLRVTALTTKILLSFYDGLNGLYCYALDPAAPATALGGSSTTLTNTNYGQYYDIVKVAGADQAVFACRQSPTTSYLVGTVTAALVKATSVKARTCDGPIAVSCSPTGTQVQIVRANGTNIQGDLITLSTLADVFTAQAIGTVSSTPVNQIAAAHRSVQNGGQYRCYAFWSYAENGDTLVSFGTKYNWVDTNNSLGTQAVFIDHVGVASRAFDFNGSVFVWIAFAAASFTTEAGGPATQVFGQVQNSYFLYRDDVFLTAKAANGVAGGYAASTGALPGVALTGTNEYTWCGVERRKIPLGKKLEGYSARAPRQIAFTFDSNEARRCARLGQTLYIACAEGCLQYDGAGLYEVGFHTYPWELDLTDWAAGNMDQGTYAYKLTWRWDNAKGERERSTTATSGLVTLTADNREVSIIPWCAGNITHKTLNPAAAELWRTPKNPVEDAPYYLVTDSDPTAITNPNRYMPNDPTAMALSVIFDSIADEDLLGLEQNPENGAFLEYLAPPPASIILASDTRLFLAGIAADPDRIWYSRQRNQNEVAAFHDELTVDVPAVGGAITGLAMLSGTLIVFREHAIYELPGDGFDNTSGGNNYGPARLLSSEVGADNQESIVQVPDGLLFKCSKGWYVLTRAGSVVDVGDAAYAYNSEAVLAAHVMQNQQQVRILTGNRMLVWDYKVNQWGEWSIASGLDAALWNDQHLYLTSTGPRAQQSTYSGVNYGYDVETTWIKTTNDMQGRAIVRMFQLLGEFRAASSIRIRCARNYESDGAGGWNYTTDKTWVVTPTVVGGPLKLAVAPNVKRPIAAFKVRLTALAADGVSAPSGETTKLTGITLAVADEGGLYSGLPAAQKQ